MFAQLSLISALLILQSACQFNVGAFRGSPPAVPSPSSQQKTSPKALVGPAYLAYAKEVKTHWTNNDYEWLESEAKRHRASKERLPGGHWKLHVLHRSIEAVVSAESSDESWMEHFARLDQWVKQRPASLMARILNAEAWRAYAFKARGTGYSNTVKPESWVLFNERLQKTNEILAEALTLEEKCPEWYRTALRAALGQGGNREAFEKLYEEGVSLEPTYFYLYSAKALYLLPQWYGKPGEWESFAETAANRVGGEQGDIILFNIYADMMGKSNLEFMSKHQAIAPRLLAGFRAIDKLYGSSPLIVNEACLISFSTNDNKAPAELMKRIGDDYDLTVWRDESTFNIFRQEALKRTGEQPRYAQPQK